MRYSAPRIRRSRFAWLRQVFRRGRRSRRQGHVIGPSVSRRRRTLRMLLGSLLMGLCAVLAYFLITRLERTVPTIETALAGTAVGQSHVQDVVVRDVGQGVAQFVAWVHSNGSVHEITRQRFAGNFLTGASGASAVPVRVLIDPKGLELQDGPAMLRLEARDFSWWRNAHTVEIPLVIDTRPPHLALQTGVTYASPGATRLVVYQVHPDDAIRHGVQVGAWFAPGYPFPGKTDTFVAFYTLPFDAKTDARPQLMAADQAGNETRLQIPLRISSRRDLQDTMTLSNAFMERKVKEIHGPSTEPLLEAYLSINRVQRQQDHAQLRELCRQSSPERLWEGVFVPLPGGQRRARFGEYRTYSYQGRVVDQQWHLGLDYASTMHAPVPAANRGRVVWNEVLGIYGRTVLLDHGMGLFSLYAHLADVTVSQGDIVTTGTVLGHTGTSGLAGGDHLHFAILVHGEFVDPLEWLDPKWLQEHVYTRLDITEE